MAPLWFEGFGLTFTEEPPVVVLPNHPSVAKGRQRAAAELDRLAGLGKIHWYQGGLRPPDLRVRPPHLVAKEDKVRVIRDWSSALYPLNSVLSNPPVQYGAMDDFLHLLAPGAYMVGTWCVLFPSLGGGAVAPPLPRGQTPAVRRAGGVPLSPLNLGPSPGWNGRCVKAVLAVARSKFPGLRIADFADDIRLVDVSGGHDVLAAGMTGLVSRFEQIGIRYCAKAGKRWRPTRLIPWLGFEVDARDGRTQGQ